MIPMRRLAAVTPVLALLLLSGCSMPSGTPRPVEATTEPPAASERTEVDWENYPGSQQQIIDEEEAEADCAALQEMFDIADNADDAQRDRTGDGNADLMGYIDEAMKLAGCYE